MHITYGTPNNGTFTIAQRVNGTVRFAWSTVVTVTMLVPGTTAVRAAAANSKVISSIGFSGAGFLAAYHLGVAACLADQGILPSQRHQPADTIRLTGVSAGSLVAAAIAARVDVATCGMEAVLQISHTTRQAGRLDALQPGFSLIDVVEGIFDKLLRAAADEDPELFLQRVNGGLRIGLTDRRVFPPVGYNPKAFVYVDKYRSVDDVVAACILSSYVPGVTGPALGSLAIKNHAVVRAARLMTDMIKDGCVKKGTTGETVQVRQYTSNVAEAEESRQQKKNRHVLGREICWDGGLVNAFPTIDHKTIIVSPVAADFTNDAISPAIEYSAASVRKLVLNPVVTLHLTAANAAAVRCMVLSSEDSVLEKKFAQGYDNAKQFLNHRSFLSAHHVQVTQTRNLNNMNHVKY
jgi:hypothetical protein